MNRHQTRNFNEDWNSEALFKFPKIDTYLKNNNSSQHEMRGSLLNDIRLKEEREFKEKLRTVDAKMNINTILKYDKKYTSFVRNRKPISTFLAPNIINRIVHNVKVTKRNPLYDYSSDNFGKKSLPLFQTTGHACQRFKRLEKTFEDFHYRKTFEAIDEKIRLQNEEAENAAKEAKDAKVPDEANDANKEPEEKKEEGNWETAMEESVYFTDNVEKDSEKQVPVEADKPKPKSRLSPIESIEDIEDPTDMLAELKNGEKQFERQLTRENSLLKLKQQEIQTDFIKKREVSNVSVESLKLVGFDD